MAVAVVPREDNAFANDNPPPARNAVFARYRQLREISKRHHHDILKRTPVWLVDIGREASLEEGAMMATRLYAHEQFSMTAGVNVPFDLALIEDLYDALPRRLGETRLTALIDDRRFAETIYRVALADGIMDRVTYQDPPEDAS